MFVRFCTNVINYSWVLCKKREERNGIYYSRSMCEYLWYGMCWSVPCWLYPWSGYKEGAGAEAKEDGFDPTDKQLYIDPEECIDCGACEPECPVEAIFEEDAVPEEWKKFIKINYDYFGREYDG